MGMTKQSDNQHVHKATRQRCIRCQSRRDERAMILRKMRGVRKQTSDILLKYAQLKEQASSEAHRHLGVRQRLENLGVTAQVTILNGLVTTMFKVLREYPIVHDDVGACSPFPLQSSQKNTVH
jgi:hypothetical protein